MNFDEAFSRLLGHEGGYVDNPKDPGGETNWGISKRSYPDQSPNDVRR
jgi:lysozyme family protein